MLMVQRGQEGRQKEERTAREAERMRCEVVGKQKGKKGRTRRRGRFLLHIIHKYIEIQTTELSLHFRTYVCRV